MSTKNLNTKPVYFATVTEDNFDVDIALTSRKARQGACKTKSKKVDDNKVRQKPKNGKLFLGVKYIYFLVFLTPQMIDILNDLSLGSSVHTLSLCYLYLFLCRSP